MARPPHHLMSGVGCTACRYGDHAECGGDASTRGSKVVPCECKRLGHPADETCRAWVKSSTWSHTTSHCCNPVKGTRPERHPGFGKTGTFDQPACGTHIGAWKRIVANDAKRAAEAKARRDGDEARAATRQASEDWAARLSAEFGVDAKAVRPDFASHLAVEVKPEHLYALLSAAAGALRDVGVEWDAVRAEVVG